MASLGVEWYQFFWDGFPTYIRDHNISWGKQSSDKEWSTMMFGFLEEMSKDMNYHVKREESTIKSSRFDMTWRSSDKPPKQIFIEHENQLVEVALKEEVRKLANYRADLHVCITYVKADEFPGDEYATDAKTSLEDIGYADEFLLILGSYNMDSPTDWACHRFHQKPFLDHEKLILPSPIILVPGQASKSTNHIMKEADDNKEVEDWLKNRLRVWKRIQQKGGSVTRVELHDIAKQVGMDNRGLGGFFAGNNRSLFWKQDRVFLSERALELVRKLGNKVD